MVNTGTKKIILIISLILILIIFFSKYFNKTETKKIETKIVEDKSVDSNIIENVSYSTKDASGNEYIINALQGEIDYTNPNILFLTKLRAIVKMSDTSNVTITSDYGKYNTDNFDTIFSKNVIIRYLDNRITGEYLDFSIGRNSMIISRNVIFENLENILNADVIEMNIKTKDAKIFNYEKEKKVKIKNK